MKEILIDDELTAKHSEAIEAGFPSAEAKFDRILEKNFDKFELYAQRNILRVPAHIDPTGGMPDTWLNQCSTTTTAADEEAMDGEIAELRRKIQKAKFVHDAMDHKLGEYTSQLAQAQSLFKALEQSDKLVSAAGVEDLPRAVQSVVEGGREVAIVESQFKALDQVMVIPLCATEPFSNRASRSVPKKTCAIRPVHSRRIGTYVGHSEL
jgi:hypothetical protein